MKIKGQVVRKPLSPGSKSERSAVVLQVGQDEYVLRRRGENPFADDALSGLVGENVELDGVLHGSIFLIDP